MGLTTTHVRHYETSTGIVRLNGDDLCVGPTASVFYPPLPSVKSRGLDEWWYKIIKTWYVAYLLWQICCCYYLVYSCLLLQNLLFFCRLLFIKLLRSHTRTYTKFYMVITLYATIVLFLQRYEKWNSFSIRISYPKIWPNNKHCYAGRCGMWLQKPGMHTRNKKWQRIYYAGI